MLQHAAPHTDAPVKALSMGLSDLHKLLLAADKLDGAETTNRQHARYRLRSRAPISQVSLFDSGQNSRTITVLHRNLSRGGASILHTAYVHVGTRCKLHVADSAGVPHAIDGDIVRCQHVTGVAYEVGIKFSAEIDVRLYASMDTLAGQFSLEQVDASKLKGKVMIVTSHGITGEILRKHLADCPLEVHTVGKVEEASALKTQRWSTIIVDIDTPHAGSSDFLTEMSSSGSPIVAMSSDLSAQQGARVRAAGAAILLALPCDKKQLMCALAETMIVGLSEETGGAVLSRHHRESEWKPLITECVEELRTFAKDGMLMLDKGQFAELRAGVARIAGTAGSVGFVSVHSLCRRVIERVDAGAGLDELRKLYGSLLSLCNRAQIE